MAIKTVPLPCIDAQWMNEVQLKRSSVNDFTLLLFDDRLAGQAVQVRLPESMGTLVNAKGTFCYVVGQEWKVSKDGRWSYDATSLQQFGKNNKPRAFNGEIFCATKLDGDTLRADLTLRNGNFTTWKAPYLWVCVMYMAAPAFDPKTLVSVNGKWAPYEETCGEWRGPAGMRVLTAQGLSEIERLESEGYKVNCPFPRDLIADPRRAGCATVNGRDVSVIVSSDHAVLLGGYDTNPCTDMAIGFGDLGPGQRETRSVEVRLIDGPPR